MPKENEKSKNNFWRFSTKSLCVTAIFTAMNVAVTFFNIPVPGGHLYLNDIIIVIAAILLNPVEALIVGGLGAFLGDLMVYPVTMFYSFLVHGLQGFAVSVTAKYLIKNKPVISALIGCFIGAVIMVGGYTFFRALFYSTPEAAIIKLPFEILQGATGFLGIVICFPLKIKKFYDGYFPKE